METLSEFDQQDAKTATGEVDTSAVEVQQSTLNADG